MNDFDTRPGALESGRHPVNVTHLVFGVILATCAGVWGLLEAGALPDADLQWLLPLPWLLAGIAGVLAVTFGGRSRRRPLDPGTQRPDDVR